MSVKNFFQKLTFIFLFFFFSENLFAYGGLFAGEKDVKVLKTQWFDIIYSPECQVSASILYEKADSLYDELFQVYDCQYRYRMPIVITPAVENFNAYFTSFPYNHIVIFDTGIHESLEVFSESILSVFKHELTHAVTLNLENSFNRLLGLLFCDGFSLSQINVTSGLAEGATVSWESKDGEGRLNNDYSLHPVRQAKIEGFFPSFYDVQGARDLYPSGSYYMFNGAFADWLIQNYGIEKYAHFFYDLQNLNGFPVSSVFKKNFGEKLKSAWKDFYEDFKSPDIISNPIEAGLSKDFFLEENTSYSVKNDKGCLYSHLCVGKDSLVYVEEITESVYLQKEDKIEKLFSLRNICEINLSCDGRYVTAGYIDSSSGLYKKKIKIYDIENKKWIKIKDTGLSNGAILRVNDKDYLLCQNFISQHYGISLYEIDKESFEANFLQKWSMKYGQTASSFVDLGLGEFAYIFRENLSYFIEIRDLQGNVKKQLKLGDDITGIKHLKSDLHIQLTNSCESLEGFSETRAKKLIFSCSKKGNLPGLGIIDLEKDSFSILEENISGGVFYPNFGQSLEDIIYIGEFYLQNRLLKLNEDGISFAQGSLEKVQGVFENKEITLSEVGIQEDVLVNSEKVNVFSYLLNGALIPAKLDTVYSLQGDELNESFFPWALSYYTSLPWKNQKGFIFSLAADYEFNNYAVDLNYSCQADTNSFYYQVGLCGLFNKKGFSNLALEAEISLNLPLINYFTLGFNDFELALINRQGEFCNYNLLSYGISNVHKADTNRFAYRGFYLNNITSFYYKKPLFTGQTGFSFGFYLPKLLPLDSYYSYVYNLPSKFSLNLFSLEKNFTSGNFFKKKLPEYDLFNVNLSTVLFGKEFQKAITFFPFVYANDLSLMLNYQGGFSLGDDATSWKILSLGNYLQEIKTGTLCWGNNISLVFNMSFTPNIGALANANFKGNFYFKIAFILGQGEKSPFFDLGISSSF